MKVVNNMERCAGDWRILYGLIGYEQLILTTYGDSRHYTRVYMLFGLINLFVYYTG